MYGHFVAIKHMLRPKTCKESLIFMCPFNCKCKNCCISCSIISTDEHIEAENQLIAQKYSPRVTKIVHVTLIAPTENEIKGEWKEGFW